MNVLTEIIQLRSSCQLVWNTLDDIEKARVQNKDTDETPQIDFAMLDNAVYFMSKCISIMDMLGVYDADTNPEGILKEKDVQVFKKIQQRICHELKEQMQVAIDLFNMELEEQVKENEANQTDGEENVKKIAHMFKLINMHEEGMKFYTNFIMVGKHSTVTHNN